MKTWLTWRFKIGIVLDVTFSKALTASSALSSSNAFSKLKELSHLVKVSCLILLWRWLLFAKICRIVVIFIQRLHNYPRCNTETIVIWGKWSKSLKLVVGGEPKVKSLQLGLKITKVNYEKSKSDPCILHGTFPDWCTVLFFVIGKRERSTLTSSWRENGTTKTASRGPCEESPRTSSSWAEEKGGQYMPCHMTLKSTGLLILRWSLSLASLRSLDPRIREYGLLPYDISQRKTTITKPK